MESKKILVFSDTHGSVGALKLVFNWANDRLPPQDTICAAAFLGDGIADIQSAADATGFYSNWKIIAGNNDFEYSTPSSGVFDFEDHCFFMCHGHKHGIYQGDYGLINGGKTAKADAVLFGHAHVPYYKKADGILLINPGSLGRPRGREGSTFAVIECIPGEPLKTEFFSIKDRGEIKPIKIAGQ